MSVIGLVVGGGVGPELAEVFREAVSRFSESLGISVEIEECSHRPRSYAEMHTWPDWKIKQAVQEDTKELVAFYKAFTARGGEFIFRLPVNAEALYAMRRQLSAFKFDPHKRRGQTILLVRDMFQGFYANNSWHVQGDKLLFEGSFSEQAFARLAKRSTQAADSLLHKGYKTWLLYKHHLFGNVLERWAKRVLPEAEILQPGAGLAKLWAHRSILAGDVLLIAGNEIGDFIHEILLAQTEAYTRETAVAHSLYLDLTSPELLEYQTVHGSADDMVGTNRVNPIATLRAAACLVNQLAKDVPRPHLPSLLENILFDLFENRKLTGRYALITSTSEVVSEVLARITLYVQE